MTTSWTLPAQSIINDALQLIGQLGAGQTASASDYDVCLTALQNVIKELPLHGYTWPKITAPRAALQWSVATPRQVSMPVDYYGSPDIAFGLSPDNKKLRVVSKAEYEAIKAPAQTATYPELIYIAANNVGYMWPVPTVNPVLSITYQAIAADVLIGSAPDVMQTWIGGLGLWLAYEVCPKFGVDMATRADIERRFMMRRALMLKHAVETAPICFGVVE